MKKTCLFTMAFTLLSGTTFAYTEHFEDGYTNPVTPTALTESQEKLRDAIQLRRSSYFKNKVRDGAYKNRKNQQERHIEGKKSIHVSERSTKSNREGELKFVPYYEDRDEHSNVSYYRPNRKQTFRRRAINYYREGGYAGTTELKDNVIYGSQHKVNIIPSRWMKQNADLEEITKDIRDVQRDIGESEQVATGYQKTTFRRGSSNRNFMSPYQR